MDRPRRRPEPVAIDITWVSCRGVRSSLLFHTPCLYASIFVVSSSAKNALSGPRRHHRVKTPTDRAGGENPEWDAPLRLYLPDASPTPAQEPDAAGGKNKKGGGGDDSSSGGNDDVLLLKFELKAEVAVLGDVHTASAAVRVPDLVADGRTRRVSYQLVGPDGKQPNGVVSFSYAIHERTGDDGHSSDDDSEPATPPCCHTPAASAAAVALPLPPTVTASPRLYPEIEWTLQTTEQPPVFPPVTAKPFTFVADTQYYPPAPPPPRLAPPAPVEATSVYPPAPPVDATSFFTSPPTVVDPASAVYPPPVLETSFCSVYPTVVVEKTSALYPTLDLAPVSYYLLAPAYGVECGYAAAPGWGEGDRCLYG